MTKTSEAASSAKANKPDTSATISPQEPVAPVITELDLKQFYGTEAHYSHWLKQFVYTDGVKYLAQKAKAYWLLDAIASYQPSLLKDKTLKDFQIWKLVVDKEKKTATLICERDVNDVVVTQVIDYTDFPLSQVKLYLVKKVLMLLSEY
jgi:hypothetical protein